VAFAEKYVRGGVVANGTQSAQAIGVYFALIPGDQKSAAFSKLVEAVESKGCAPHTGIFSTRYMLMALSENGRVGLARKIVLHKGFPGFLYMIERGATTLWETWKESDDIYSNCHPMFGSVDEWIIKFGKDADSH
jgi:alpha-L-rhamnosidase